MPNRNVRWALMLHEPINNEFAFEAMPSRGEARRNAFNTRKDDPTINVCVLRVKFKGDHPNYWQWEHMCKNGDRLNVQ